MNWKERVSADTRLLSGEWSDERPWERVVCAAGSAPAIRSLCQIAQGVLIHRDIAPRLYGLKLSDEKRGLANIRPVARMIEEIQSCNGKPLREARAPRERMPGVCWHFSSLVAAILREQGVPARTRCGFGANFTPARFEDHWVAEYWNTTEHRLVLVDAQLDSVQRAAFRVEFDSTDVPHDRFILAGDAWQQCRGGRANPDLFGLSIITVMSRACGGSRRISFAIWLRSTA